MITNTGGGVTSIILIVTDGGITDQAEAKHQVCYGLCYRSCHTRTILGKDCAK